MSEAAKPEVPAFLKRLNAVGSLNDIHQSEPIVKEKPVAPVAKPDAKVESEEDKTKREAAEKIAADKATEKKAPEDAKPKEEKPPVAPAKRVIKVAKGYEDLVKADPDAIARATATAVATEVAKVLPKPVAPVEPELTDRQKQYVAYAQEMTELHPERFAKDLPERVKKCAAELPKWEEKWSKDFQQKWEKKYATKFDDEEERNEAFDTARAVALESAKESFEVSHGLNWTDDDLEEAKRSLWTKPITEKQKQIEGELEKRREHERHQQITALAQQSASAAVNHVAEELGATVSKFVVDGKLDEAKSKEFIGSDPSGVAAIQIAAIGRAEGFADAVQKLVHGQSTPWAEHVLNFRVATENKITSDPDEQRDRNGRTFITGGELISLPQNEQQQLAFGQHPTRWTLTPEDIIARANAEIVKGTNKAVEAERARFQKALEAAGYTKKEAAAAAQIAEPKELKTEKPVSPAAVDPTTSRNGSIVLPESGGWKNRLKNGTSEGYREAVPS